jgi:hypothetical protein
MIRRNARKYQLTLRETIILKTMQMHFFPNRYRVDIVQWTDARAKEDELRTVGNLTLVADMDSWVISVRISNTLLTLLDTKTTFIFSNLINRCKPEYEIAFQVTSRTCKPVILWKGADSDYKSEWYANIQLAQVYWMFLCHQFTQHQLLHHCPGCGTCKCLHLRSFPLEQNARDY